MKTNLLEIKGLSTYFYVRKGIIKAVDGVSLKLKRKQTLGIVGESGCGKSVTVHSILRLISPPGRIVKGEVLLNGKDLLKVPLELMQSIRGNEISMIFQDPMTSLNPTMRIGDQIAETLIVHRHYSKKQAADRAVELLAATRIPDPEKRARQYPFEFSGGMLQRSMIAMAIACEPALLIADEPTTALDVTIQAQILDLLKDLQRQHGMAIILITHDLAVVARMADRVNVMYAGEIVECGSTEDIFYRSAHPYTLGLRDAMPSNKSVKSQRLQPIDGSPPDLFAPPGGCGYFARCPHAMRICEGERPPLFGRQSHAARCWLHHEDAPRRAVRLHMGTDGEQP